MDLLRKRPHTTPTSEQSQFLVDGLTNRLTSADRFGRTELKSPDCGSDSGYDEGLVYSRAGDEKYRSKLNHFIETLRKPVRF